jgi:hypothetical protein
VISQILLRVASSALEGMGFVGVLSGFSKYTVFQARGDRSVGARVKVGVLPRFPPGRGVSRRWVRLLGLNCCQSLPPDLP